MQPCNGQLALLIGKGRERYTHENKRKRVTFAVVPPADKAIDDKPRGLQSITLAIRDDVNPKSFLVFDGWRSSKSAVGRLG